MEDLLKRKKLDIKYKYGIFTMGLLSNFLFFYMSIVFDCLLDTFGNSVYHVIIVPIVFSLLFIFFL